GYASEDARRVHQRGGLPERVPMRTDEDWNAHECNVQPMPMSADLKYFTQTPILRQIGHRRLAKLLADFDQDLKASKVILPEPDPQNFDSFADLANALATQRIPHS